MPKISDHGSVVFENVTKRFSLREGNTLKEMITSMTGGGRRKPFYALNDVSFSLEPGETLGIIGRNGGGKSTILKLVAGVLAPTSGSITATGRISPLIELGAGFHPDLTGRENVFLNSAILGVKRRLVHERMDDIIAFAEMEEFMETPVKRYSSGMFVRLGFAVAVYSDPDILIVDESLAVGDAAFQDKCIQKIREFQKNGVTILFVSHNLNLVSAFCDRALLMEHGQVVMEGAAAEVVEMYESTTTEEARLVSGGLPMAPRFRSRTMAESFHHDRRDS